MHEVAYNYDAANQWRCVVTRGVKMNQPVASDSRPHRTSRRAQWRAEGRCCCCGKQPHDGKRTCEACLQRNRKQQAERKASGLCYCGRPKAEGRMRCPNCLESIRQAAKRQRKAKFGPGVCYCGKPSRPNRKTCEHCKQRGVESRARRAAAGLCICGKHPVVEGKRTCQACSDYKAALGREIRERAFQGYGGRCVCCGEDDINTLELDHVNNDGSSHRKELGGAGASTYAWAIDNGFPDRLQLLCGSCHRAKTRLGDCSYRQSIVEARRLQGVANKPLEKFAG